MAELAKPVSVQDDPGYIYMFWLTPESEPAGEPAEAARSLLAPPSTPTRPGNQRRPSDVLADFAASMDTPRTRGMQGSKGKEKKNFFTIPEYEQWLENTPDSHKWKSKYYKVV